MKILDAMKRFFGGGESPLVPSEQPYAKHLSTQWDNYRAWRDEQVCVDCGKKFGAEKGMSVNEWCQSAADDLDDSMWMTENQCVPCWKKLGAPERRGLPSARDQMHSAGINL